MRFNSALLGAVVLSLFSAHPAWTQGPVLFPSATPKCAPNAKLTVVDFSFPIAGLVTKNNKSILEVLKNDFKIDTVFRYYDHINETIPGKTLTRAEADAIIAAKMNVGVVFQHNNSKPTKFMEPGIGAKDAERALFLADQVGQPFGSAIYFGIDGPELHLEPLKDEYKRNNGGPMHAARKTEIKDELRKQITERLRNRKKPLQGLEEGVERAFERVASNYATFLKYGPDALGTRDLGKATPAMMMPVIARYFAGIREKFDEYAKSNNGAGFKIGLYCTPMACLRGDADKWAEFIWLSPEGRNSDDYKTMLARKERWHLVQHRGEKTEIAPTGPIRPSATEKSILTLTRLTPLRTQA